LRGAASKACPAGPVSTDSPDHVETLTWACPKGADVEFIAIGGAGHAWPAVPLDGATALCDFFSRQSLAH
jgi:poly(3-hydroxybutyrate) depolymerase